VEDLAKGGPAPKDGDPGQPGLKPFEAELLVKRPVAVERPAPLFVVITQVFRV
jgi:hypothetical protein